jgi:hypothetical protein
MHMTVRQKHIANGAPRLMGQSLGSARKSLSIIATLWDGILIAEEKHFNMGLGSLPLTNISTNFSRRFAIAGRLVISRESSGMSTRLGEGMSFSA